MNTATEIATYTSLLDELNQLFSSAGLNTDASTSIATSASLDVISMTTSRKSLVMVLKELAEQATTLGRQIANGEKMKTIDAHTIATKADQVVELRATIACLDDRLRQTNEFVRTVTSNESFNLFDYVNKKA